MHTATDGGWRTPAATAPHAPVTDELQAEAAEEKANEDQPAAAPEPTQQADAEHRAKAADAAGETTPRRPRRPIEDDDDDDAEDDETEEATDEQDESREKPVDQRLLADAEY